MKRKRLHPLLVIVLGFVLGVALNNVLIGWSEARSPLDRLMAGFNSLTQPLSDSNKKQFDRFSTAYKAQVGDEDVDEELDLFKEVYRNILNKYVNIAEDRILIDSAIGGLDKAVEEGKDLSSDGLMEASLDAMLSGLDPHSSYLNPTEAREMDMRTRGEFGGLGIEVMMGDDGVKVIAPMEGTPAYRAGIESGDLITHVDGEAVAGWSLFKAVKRMRGTAGTKIRLTLRRKGREPFDVTITRAVIQVRAVRWRTEGDIGYIRIVTFSENVEYELAKAFRGVDNELGRRLKGYVLDLRGNAGGLLDQSVFAADALLDDGLIVSIKSRSPRAGNNKYWAEKGDLAHGHPIVVLIDGGSASASEIVAGAIQDHARGIILGMRSFGKGSVQTLAPLGNDGILRLTTALYYTASGRTIQGHGVVPDILVPLDDDAEESEPARESSLPHAIEAGGNGDEKPALATIDKDRCKPVVRNDREDYHLGCALDLLAAGSASDFLAELRSP